MIHRIRSALVLRRHERIEWNHIDAPCARGPHIDIRQVLRSRAKLGIGLRLHMIDTTELDEVIDVKIAEVGLERIKDIRNRHPQGLRAFPIHIGIESW